MPESGQQIEIHADLTPIKGPTLDQYFGPWFMDEAYFMQEVQALQSIDLTAHIRQASGDPPTDAKAAEKPFDVVRSNIARIDIEGTMTKRGSSFGPPGTIFARRQVRAAVNDPEIAGIFLRIDSPGGTMAGTKDLADDVFAATRRKPVMTFFEDTGASAAYYVGAQATVKRANASAVIGSIGVVLIVMDMSELAAKQGIKVHVISTGPFKGAGAPGSEVTESHLEYFQERINQGNELFLADVSRGTSLSISQVRELADGRVHFASRAAELGLIDGIASMDEALDELVSLTSPKRTVSMSTEKVAATLAELKASFPDASSEFLLAQLEKDATIAEATSAFLAYQQAELAKAKAEAEQARQEAIEAKKAAEEAAKAMPGNNPMADSGDGTSVPSGTAKERWDALVESEIERLGGPEHRRQAVVNVDIQNPGLRQQWMAEWKPEPKLEQAPVGYYPHSQI